MSSFKGKHVLVTGGSRGIGRAIVETLSKQGATVAFQYHQNQQQADDVLNDLNESCISVQADLSQVDQIQSCFNHVLSEFGKLDVVINNAGVALSSAIDMNDEAWLKDLDYTFDVNFKATALLCKHAIAEFKKQGSGILINIASRAAHRGDTADYMVYAASKGAVISLTKSIARAYGKEGITAFSVAPGFVRTDMSKDFITQYGEAIVERDLSLDKMTEPQDVANIVAFLASGQAKHATGSTFDVNAGSYMR